MGYLSIYSEILQFIPSTQVTNSTERRGDPKTTSRTGRSHLSNVERTVIMKTAYASAIALAVAALTAGQALAADDAVGKTRAEVRAELAEAIRTGNIVESGESSLTLAERFPNRYPAQAVAAGKTRAEVQAETLRAIREGNIMGPGESSLTLAQQFPQQYNKAQPAVVGKTRAEVRAETLRAIREGDIMGPGESSLTLAEMFPNQYTHTN